MKLNDDKIWSWDGMPIPAWKVDPEHYAVTDPTKVKTYNLHQTLRHETGHLLGLVHSNDCKTCVMYPYYNGTLELAPLDIDRIVLKYGKRSWTGNWYLVFKKAIFNWTRRKPKTLNDS